MKEGSDILSAVGDTRGRGACGSGGGPLECCGGGGAPGAWPGGGRPPRCLWRGWPPPPRPPPPPPSVAGRPPPGCCGRGAGKPPAAPGAAPPAVTGRGGGRPPRAPCSPPPPGGRGAPPSPLAAPEPPPRPPRPRERRLGAPPPGAPFGWPSMVEEPRVIVDATSRARVPRGGARHLRTRGGAALRKGTEISYRLTRHNASLLTLFKAAALGAAQMLHAPGERSAT